MRAMPGEDRPSGRGVQALPRWPVQPHVHHREDLHAVSDQHVEERGEHARVRGVSPELGRAWCDGPLRMHLCSRHGDAKHHLPALSRGHVLGSGRVPPMPKRNLLRNRRRQRVSAMPLLDHVWAWFYRMHFLRGWQCPVPRRRLVHAVPGWLLLRGGCRYALSAGVVLPQNRSGSQDAMPALSCQLFLQNPYYDTPMPPKHVVTDRLHKQAFLPVQRWIQVHLLHDRHKGDQDYPPLSDHSKV